MVIAVILLTVIIIVVVVAAPTLSSSGSSDSSSSGSSSSGSSSSGTTSPGHGVGAVPNNIEDEIVALSVSGNGYLAEAAAAGTLKALNTAGILSELKTISSVSGGSWFNTQFGFSKTYFDGVTNSSLSIYDFYMNYQLVSTSSMAGYFSSPLPHTWQGLVTTFLNAWDPGLTVPAVNANRAGNTNADLLFCTTFIGKTLNSDNTTTTQLSSNGENVAMSIPAFWAVPTSGSESWNVPELNVDNLTWTSTTDLKWTSSKGESTTNISSILMEPTVAKIATMSSAANGITANPELIDAYIPNGVSYESQFSTTPGATDPGNGVCTTSSETCDFPSMKTMDGCYSDNLGFALNVGYLQKKYPGQSLKLVAVSSNYCDRTTDPTCLSSVTGTSFRSFFTGAPYSTAEGWLPAVVPGPDRTIFAESITDAQALGQQTGYGGMTFFTGNFTTVENPRFGVAAGTTVRVIILNVNGPLYISPQSEAEFTGLATVATNAEKSVTSILNTLSSTGKIDSSSAFVYYQDPARL